MSLIAVQTLADYLGVEATESGLQAYLNRAEAFTATILGATSLEERSATETVTVDMRQSNNGLSGGVYDPNIFYFSDGPVTGVTSVSLNGTDVTSDIQLSDRGWFIHYPVTLRSFRFDPAFYDPGLFTERYIATLEVSYTAGWTEEELPNPIKQYVLMTAAKYHSIPVDGVYQVRIGDNQVALDKDMFEAEYKRNEALINRYKRSYL